MSGAFQLLTQSDWTILGGAAFIASLIPARRAALADPVIALRQY